VDVGESLVGAYLRHMVRSDVVVYNSFFADRQGKVDVVGLTMAEPRRALLCEVTTHVGGMLIVRHRRDATAEVVREKVERMRDFANLTFPDFEHRFEWWSPRVPEGKVTTALETLRQDYENADVDLQFVINSAYTERIRELARHAKHNTSTTNEPAYRLLQVLTHLRGDELLNL
jgi:hypothetical protein